MSVTDIAELRKTYATDVARIERMLANALTVNSIEFLYSQMMASKFEPTMEWTLTNDAMQTALVVAYGRLFSASDGATQLQVKHIPKELIKTHEELMGWRHKRFAHHGAHPSKTTAVELVASEDGVLVNMSIQLGFWVGASKEWAPMFAWLRSHIHDSVNEQMAYLSKKSGLRWHMLEGPPPPWVATDEASS